MKFTAKTGDTVLIHCGGLEVPATVTHSSPTLICVSKLRFRRKDGSLIRPKRHRLSASAFRQFRLVKGESK